VASGSFFLSTNRKHLQQTLRVDQFITPLVTPSTTTDRAVNYDALEFIHP
jgi:hypothetical protein